MKLHSEEKLTAISFGWAIKSVNITYSQLNAPRKSIFIALYYDRAILRYEARRCKAGKVANCWLQAVFLQINLLRIYLLWRSPFVVKWSIKLPLNATNSYWSNYACTCRRKIDSLASRSRLGSRRKVERMTKFSRFPAVIRNTLSSRCIRKYDTNYSYR